MAAVAAAAAADTVGMVHNARIHQDIQPEGTQKLKPTSQAVYADVGKVEY